jgi:hypothetical protein
MNELFDKCIAFDNNVKGRIGGYPPEIIEEQIPDKYKFLYNFVKNIKNRIAHNVPAVYDGLAARIRKCAAFPGPTNCGWNEPWEAAADLGEWNPGGPKDRNAYRPVEAVEKVPHKTNKRYIWGMVAIKYAICSVLWD